MHSDMQHHGQTSSLGELEKKALDAIAAAGALGKTRDELSEHLRRPIQSICPAIAKLKKFRLIATNGATRLTKYGHPAEVLVRSSQGDLPLFESLGPTTPSESLRPAPSTLSEHDFRMATRRRMLNAGIRGEELILAVDRAVDAWKGKVACVNQS